MNKTAVLLCKCRGEHFNKRTYSETESYLENVAADLYLVDDLCAASLTETIELKEISLNYEHTIILACQPRAVKHLLIQNHVTFNEYTALNIRDKSISESLKDLAALGLEAGKGERHELISALNVPSWYPIIDQEKCSVCGRCSKFCLFGVYQIKDKKLEVKNPLNCKNNCPACARTCPESAIMFPKLGEQSTISGAEVTGKAAGMTVLQGNIGAQLKERSYLRKSILKESVVQMAEKERVAALKNSNQPIVKKND